MAFCVRGLKKLAPGPFYVPPFFKLFRDEPDRGYAPSRARPVDFEARSGNGAIARAPETASRLRDLIGPVWGVGSPNTRVWALGWSYDTPARFFRDQATAATYNAREFLHKLSELP